jgi:hypothetical protein
MFEDRVRYIIEEKFVDLVGNVIDELRNLPIQSLQENTHSPFDNVWDSYVDQLQQEDDNPDHTAFTNAIMGICQQSVETLSFTELKLLWLITEGCLAWQGEDVFPEIEKIAQDVAEELFSWIEQEAEEPEFELDDGFEEEEYDDDDDPDEFDDESEYEEEYDEYPPTYYQEEQVKKTRH